MKPVWTDPQDCGHLLHLRQANPGINPRSHQPKRKGAFVSESALHFDGDKPNSVVRRLPDVMIIYLSPLAWTARSRRSETVMRRYPRINGAAPSLCSVLHHMGFFVPRGLLRER